MSDRGPASRTSLPTLVPRTTSTSACVLRTASASAASFNCGSYHTSHPALRQPSIALCSNVSAITTFTRPTLLRRALPLGLPSTPARGPVIPVTRVGSLAHSFACCLPGRIETTSSNQMNEQPVSQLGLEPGRLRRHDAALVGDRHEIVDLDGEHREGHGGLAGIDGAHQRIRPPRAPDEVDSLVGANVADIQQVFENAALQTRHIQAAP